MQGANQQRLLSPQHCDQTQKDTQETPGTMEITNHVSSTLKWKQGQYKRTAMLSKNSNIAIFWLPLGFREFEAYEATAGFTEANDSQPIIADQVHMIEDDEIPYCKPTNP